MGADREKARITRLSNADYVIKKMALALPENTILVECDGQIAWLSERGDAAPGDAITVRFLDLSDGWRWDAVVGRCPVDARMFIDNWCFVVEQWHRMMMEKGAP